VTYFPLEDALPGDGEPGPLVTKRSAGFLIPQALLGGYAGMDIGDWIDKVMRGEIVPPSRREPKRHRCLACWLVSLLPGHGRCAHGYLESACETCGEW
jgi:hypothetical protein